MATRASARLEVFREDGTTLYTGAVSTRAPTTLPTLPVPKRDEVLKLELRAGRDVRSALVPVSGPYVNHTF